MNLFYRYFAPEIPLGTAPLYNRIDHGLLPINKTDGVNWNWILGEEELDLEIALPIIYPQTATIFEVGPAKGYGNNFWNRMLDAIDGSYCTPAQQGNSSLGELPQCGTFKSVNRCLNGQAGLYQCFIIQDDGCANASEGRLTSCPTRGAFRSTNTHSTGKSVSATSISSWVCKGPLSSSVHKTGKAHL